MSFGGADLHCHSIRSDGLDTPARLVERALEARLSALALSDHDAVHGLPELEAAARGTGLIPVAGVELSTRSDDEDVHLLGLFVDPTEPRLLARLAEMRTARDRRGEAMVERLREAGIDLDLEAIRTTVGGGAFGRPHVARALMQKGVVATFDEAFDRWLSRGRPGYVPKPKWSLPDAIGAVRGAGGLAVLAHPIWYDDPPALVAAGLSEGLDGVEVGHPDQDGAQEEAFAGLAREAGLLVTAGSDYHGPPQGGKTVGGRRLPEEGWLRLVEAARRRRASCGLPAPDFSPR